MLIGERRVPLDTLVPFIPGSLHRPMYFRPKYKMAAQLLLLNEMLDFSLEEECHFNQMMMTILPRNKGFYQNILLAYKLTIDEFKSHYRMTRGTFEALCREVQATGRVPKSGARP